MNNKRVRHLSSIGRLVLIAGLLGSAGLSPARARRGATRTPPRSVEVYKGRIRVYTRPNVGSALRGEITRAGRYPVTATRPRGGGCATTWYRLGAGQWACSGWLLPRKAPPGPLRDVARAWRPGTFFGRRASRKHPLVFYPSLRHFSRGGALYLRGDLGFEALSKAFIGGRAYLRTRGGGYVVARELFRYPQSALLGVTLGSRAKVLPLAIAIRDSPLYRPPTGGKASIAPQPAGKSLLRYEVRRVKRLVTLGGRRYAQLRGKAGFLVTSSHVALATTPPPRPKAVGLREHWVDIDVTERLVYAMRGPRPVRVMLTSVGKKTPPGVFRVEQKLVWKDMAARRGPDPFYLESVPFVVFFHGDFALHGAYWHDQFGTRLSHGCLNLSLTDAHFVFNWLGPELRPGYHAIWPTKGDRGDVVRVRGEHVQRGWEKLLRVSPRRPSLRLRRSK